MPRRKYAYKVMAKGKGGRGERVMLNTGVKAEADAFFRKHPRATHIQRFRGRISAGVTQPGIKNKIRRGGVTYEKAYLGPHSKRWAQKVAQGFRKDGHRAITTSSKRGSFIYVKVRTPRRR